MENGNGKPGRHRASDTDRHVGARMRERRIMLGLTQQQMAELIGVTYQQSHKYEKGVNRISAGRLYQVAQALGVPVDYFFEGLSSGIVSFPPTGTQRRLLQMAQDFAALPNRQMQDAIAALVRAMSDDNGDGP